jgi:hypothetical protein
MKVSVLPLSMGANSPFFCQLVLPQKMLQQRMSRLLHVRKLKVIELVE